MGTADLKQFRAGVGVHAAAQERGLSHAGNGRAYREGPSGRVGADGEATDNRECVVKKSVAATRRAQRNHPQEWRQAMVELIGQQRQAAPGLSVRRMCGVLTLGRATYYRAWLAGAGRARDRKLRRLVLAWPA